MEIITRNEKILYIGIDVHKDTYSLCSFDFHKNELSDEMTIKATTKAGNKRVRALFCESVKAIKQTNPYGQKSEERTCTIFTYYKKFIERNSILY